jgi:hypothetical protein
VLAEHARLAVDPNNVAGTDDPSPAGNGSWWAKMSEEAHDDGIAEEGALHTTALDREVDDTDDQHVARARVRNARMRRWNYAPLRHDHRRQSAEIFVPL